MNYIEQMDFLKNTSLEDKKIYYKGDLDLLQRRKVSIVGSRKPTSYARNLTFDLASRLAKSGIVVVSGGAIGIDAVAHKAAGAENTIMVAATGLDMRYPAVNKKLIEEIEQKGLVLSQFEEGVRSRAYHFPLRNELTVALGEVLIVSYADLKSGSMHSVEYAKKQGKKIYVLPHRLGESEGTNALLAAKEAEAIYDIEEFVVGIAGEQRAGSKRVEDEFLNFCKNRPTYEEAQLRYGAKLFEYELAGKVVVKEGRVFLA